MLGAAHEGIAAFEETEQLVRGAGDADAHAFADAADGMVDFAEPECFIGAEVDAVMAAVDLQSLREAPRAAREIEKPRGFAMTLHDFDAFERFERANQNGGGGFGGLAHDIEHEVVAVIEKNVDVAGSKIHGTDARRWPAKVMPGRIARRISFGLDDAAADAPLRQFVDDDFADKETRERNGIFGKLGAANAANGSFRGRFLETGICGR